MIKIVSIFIILFSTLAYGFELIDGPPPANTVAGPVQRFFVAHGQTLDRNRLKRECPHGWNEGAVILSMRRGVRLGPPDRDGYWLEFQCFNRLPEIRMQTQPDDFRK